MVCLPGSTSSSERAEKLIWLLFVNLDRLLAAGKLACLENDYPHLLEMLHACSGCWPTNLQRITEPRMLEGTCGSHEAQPPAQE